MSVNIGANLLLSSLYYIILCSERVVHHKLCIRSNSVVGVLRDAILSALASMSPLYLCCVFIAMTQAVTWLCIVYRRRDYRISLSTLALQVSAFGCLAQRLHAHDTDLHTAVVATSVFLLVIVQVGTTLYPY